MASTSAIGHAQRLVASLDPDIVGGLQADAFAGLAGIGYELRFRPEREFTGSCSVAGSFNPGPPPTITVVQSRSVRRQRFTALHELGHRLVAEDAALADVFFELSDGGTALEEDICDAIAAEILLPSEVVDEHIGPDGPTARGVAALFHASQASREACCVRAAQRIFGVGHVMLTRDGAARFTASRGTQYRVARDTHQGDGHITEKAASNGAWRSEAPVRYAKGTYSERFFADAVADGEYVFAVFVDAKVPWIDGVTLYSGDRVDPTEAYCERCDEPFETLAAACATCGDYHHIPGCGRCSCEPVRRERCCDTCFLHKHIGQFAGDHTTCKDCLGM
jgi:Zn-dependent peptidase ImmA (M78 family)